MGLDPAVAFAWHYDRAEELKLGEDPRALDQLVERARAHRFRGLTRDTAVREGVLDSVSWDADVDRPPEERLAILIGLDDAFDDIAPNGAVVHRGRLVHVQRTYAERGRYTPDSFQGQGAVVPRWHEADRPSGVPERLSDLFRSVLRVPQSSWAAANYRVVWSDLGPTDLTGPLLIAAAPVVETLDELAIARNGRFYSIEPRDDALFERRAEAILRGLDASGALIACLPELTLTRNILDFWTDLVTKHTRPKGSKLRFLLVGTGNVDPNVPPFNRAVLLDRDSGRPYIEQDKMHGFQLVEKQIKDWGLSAYLGSSVACDEHIAHGSRLEIVETEVGRIAVLICEDLTEAIDLGRLVRDFGVTLIFTPIFSCRVQPWLWAHQSARDHIAQAGSTVIISNSLAVKYKGLADKDAGASMVAVPTGFALGAPEDGTDVVLFEYDETDIDEPIRASDPIRPPGWMITWRVPPGP